MDNPSSSESPDVAEGVSECHDERMQQPKKMPKEEVPAPAALEVWDEKPPEDLDELDKYIDKLEKWSAIFVKDPRDSERHMERFNKCLEKFMKDTKWIDELVSRTEREISSVGFTKREYDVCGSYLTRRPFEDENPRKYPEAIAYMDQVRQTKGYGVTVTCCELVRPLLSQFETVFTPMMNTWRKDPKLRYSIEKEMVEALLDSMFDELQQRYVSLGVTNLVRCIACRLYLVSLSVALEKEEATQKEEEAKVVEAMVFFQPDPFKMDWKLREWKLKKGPQVVYYSKSAELLN